MYVLITVGELNGKHTLKQFNASNGVRKEKEAEEMNEKVYKEVYSDLKRKKATGLSYDKYRERLQVRDEATKKKEFEERRIRL